MSSGDDSSTGDESGADWDMRSRLRRHELIIAKHQERLAVGDNQIENMSKQINEVRSWLIAVVMFVLANLILGLGTLIMGLIQTHG